MTTTPYARYNDSVLTSALGLVKMCLSHVGLTPEFTPRLFLSPDGQEICLQLTHYMKRPLINESFGELCQDIENMVLDSDLTEELRASLDSELYQAQRQIAKLSAEVGQLKKYEAWYQLEQQLLEVACLTESTVNNKLPSPLPQDVT